MRRTLTCSVCGHVHPPPVCLANRTLLNYFCAVLNSESHAISQTDCNKVIATLILCKYDSSFEGVSLFRVLWAFGNRFFMYTLIITLQHYMAVSMFRMAGAIAQNMITAYTAGAFLMLICFLLGGFLIAKRAPFVPIHLRGCPVPCDIPMIQHLSASIAG
jgi:hypothetical protein